MMKFRNIRDLLVGRLLPEPSACSESARDPGDGDRRRFRSMAENRKRQILERMLLEDDRPALVPIHIGNGQRRRP